MSIPDDSNFASQPSQTHGCCGMWFFYALFSIVFSSINYYSTFYLTQQIGPLCILYRSPGLLAFSLLYIMGNCVLGFRKKKGENEDDQYQKQLHHHHRRHLPPPMTLKNKV